MTKKQLARKLFFDEYKKTGRMLSGYELSKEIDSDTRTLCRYSAQFKLEAAKD